MRKPYDPYIVHSGAGRSRAIEPLPDMPRVLIAIPACFEFVYGRYESSESPHYNPANPAYGEDIHFSGPNLRIGTVRDTWAKDLEPFKAHVDLRFFYGTPTPREPLPDEVFLPVPDDYTSLPFKTQAIFRWALSQGYLYVFKCDDDSYVWPDRLIRELTQHRHIDYGGWEHAGYCTGGPGYWVSRRAMQIAINYSPTHFAEDITVGHALNLANIKPIMLPNHRAGGDSHWFDINQITPDCVCVHAVKPSDMLEIYRRDHAGNRTRERVPHHSGNHFL